MRLFRLLFLLAATFLALITTFAAQDRSASSPPSGSLANQTEPYSGPLIRKATNLVLVDVVVTAHNGHPVKGLGQQPFHVFENGKEQTIKVFEEHSPGMDEPRKELPALPPNTYTNVPESSNDSAINVLLLDAVNTPIDAQAYARRKIIEYLKNVPSGTRIAIFTLASKLRLVQGFTTDSSVMLAALEKTLPTESVALPGNRGETAAQRFGALPTTEAIMMQSVAPDTTDRMLASLRQFEDDEQANLMDRRIQITLNALKQLSVYLGALSGRKNVIWFSASFPLSLTPQSPLDPFKSLRGYGPQLQEVSDLLTASRVAVYPVDARGLITSTPFAGQANPPTIVHSMSGDGVHANVAILQPSLTDISDADNRRNAELATMLQLAEQTGGAAFYNDNAIKQAIGKAIENGSSYYTLAYSPEDKKFDGRFRKVQVKLSGHDYQLAYRRGYFADPPVAHNGNALLGPESPAMHPDAPPSSQIFFRARILQAGDPTAQNLPPQDGPAGILADQLKPPIKRYWIECTADMRQVSAEMDSHGIYRSTIEFLAIAYDRDGKVVNANRRGFKLGMPPATYEELLQKGYSVRNELDLPEGEVWLRLAVHDVAADRVGSIQVPLKTLLHKAD